MALVLEVFSFGSSGELPPARLVARTPRRAGISGKKKGPENFRALVIVGGGNLPVFWPAGQNPLRQRHACVPKPCLRPASRFVEKRGFGSRLDCSKNKKPP